MTQRKAPIRLIPEAGYRPQFTDREIGLIKAVLPNDVDPRRLELLPQILREWARVDLPDHFSWESAASQRQRHARLTKVGKIAASLLRATEDLDERDRWHLVARIGNTEGQPFHQAASDENRRRLDEGFEFIATIAGAAGKPLSRPRRGQPRNIPAYLVTQDLAAIYEYLTQNEATRIVDRTSHAECGPFYDFVAAIWPVVFGQGDHGLAAAIRNWAPWWHCEKSPVIANIGLRHPECGIFKR